MAEREFYLSRRRGAWLRPSLGRGKLVWMRFIFILVLVAILVMNGTNRFFQLGVVVPEALEHLPCQLLYKCIRYCCFTSYEVSGERN